METRTLKYKELRESLEDENKQIESDLTSKNFFMRIRAIYISSLECKGKRGKNEMLTKAVVSC